MSARETILEAADTLFGEVGFDAATTREIAQRSGVNKALIHYHFSSKEELFRAVLDRYYQRLHETVLTALGDGGSLTERFERLIETYVDFLAAHQGFSRMVQREAAGGPHLERVVGHMLPLFQAGTELVRAAYPATREGDLDAVQLLVSFYGMVIGYFTYSPVLAGLLGSDPLSESQLAARKRHLRRMLALTVAAAQQDGPPASDPHPGDA